jgi:hypothetical protein
MEESRTIAFNINWSDGGEQKASSECIHHPGLAFEDIVSFSQMNRNPRGRKNSCKSAFWKWGI